MFFENLSGKFKFHYNQTRMSDTLHEDQYNKFLIISPSFLLRMRNVVDRYVEKTEARFMFVAFFPPENRAIYEIMWTNFVSRTCHR